jgi:hypothetical protein
VAKDPYDMPVDMLDRACDILEESIADVEAGRS